MSRSDEYRAGFLTFVGRPNVGKSTLTNALVGDKIAITSSKPQTTRRAIRGIVTRSEGQLVIVDTPGVHRPRTLLGERLNALVEDTLSSVDVIGFCLPADQPIGPGDRFIVAEIDKFPRAKRMAIVTKTDIAKPVDIVKQLQAVAELAKWDVIVPVSHVDHEQLTTLAREALKLMPSSPSPLYPESTSTDESLEDRISELVRESALEGVSDELPHSIAVTVEEMSLRDDREMTDIYVNLYVERDSQKGIIIGHKGARLREVGQRARAQIEPLVGTRVFLSIQVKVAKDWQRDPKQLGKLGF